VAIAYATLAHVARSGANTLFVTHYPMVAEELAKEVSSRGLQVKRQQADVHIVS
jgi:DNA mismatch repair ATPase MutS